MDALPSDDDQSHADRRADSGADADHSADSVHDHGRVPSTSEWFGRVADFRSQADRREWLDRAFEYRGDVALLLTDESVVSGYIFDRRGGPTLKESVVRLLPPHSDQPMTIGYDSIAALKFTGRDFAEGRGWELWVQRYTERKRAGLTANLYPEPLDENTSAED